VQHGAITVLHVGAGGFGNRERIDFGEHWEANSQAVLQCRHIVDWVDRGRYNFDARLDERASVYCEVNQLLTTVRSPIPSVELHNTPVTGD